MTINIVIVSIALGAILLTVLGLIPIIVAGPILLVAFLIGFGSIAFRPKRRRDGNRWA